MKRLATAAVMAAAVAANAASLDLDLGAGAKIDIAPYGIENVTALATAAPWIGLAESLQAGLVAAASAGPAKSDAELAACLGVGPFGPVAAFGGAGLLASSGDGPALVPIVLGGLRLGIGRLGLAACAEVHFKPDDTDKMLWFAILWRIGVRSL